MNHVTLDSGHCRYSPASEVRLDVIRTMQAWTTSALATGGLVPLPNLDGYLAYASRYRDSLAVSVFSGEELPLTTFIVSAVGDTEAWDHFFLCFIAGEHLPVVQGEPAAPYCAVKLHLGMAIDREATAWLGDLERCIAWAWLTTLREETA